MLWGDTCRRADSRLIVGLRHTDIVLTVAHHAAVIVAVLPDDRKLTTEVGAVEVLQTLLGEAGQALATLVLVAGRDGVLDGEGCRAFALRIAEDVELGEG